MCGARVACPFWSFKFFVCLLSLRRPISRSHLSFVDAMRSVYSYFKNDIFILCMLPVTTVDVQIDTSHNAGLNCDRIEVDKRYKVSFNVRRKEKMNIIARLRSTRWLERVEQILMIKKWIDESWNENGQFKWNTFTQAQRRRRRGRKGTTTEQETCVSVPSCMEQCKIRIDPSSQFLIIESCFSFVINDTASERRREQHKNILAWSC